MKSTLPTGSNNLPSLSEYIVTETKVGIRFRDVPVGQVFWEPRSRKSYLKVSESLVHTVDAMYEHERNIPVRDQNFIVEL